MQEVICECFNCRTGQSHHWREHLSTFIALGCQNPCLKDGQWFPKPAQCPEDGSDYVPPPGLPTGCEYPPPTDGVPPPTDGVPPPTNGGPPPTPVDGQCPPGTVNISGQCSGGAIACPMGAGYTLIEVEPDPGGAGFLPTGRILATDATLQEARQIGVHIVNADDERCVTPGPTPTDECPPGMIRRDGNCCTPDEYEVSTTFDPAQPGGVCVAKHQCFVPPDYTTPAGPPVEGGVDMSFCEAPPPEDYEGGLACPTNGTFDIYDAVTGEHIASDVAVEDLPEGAEIVVVDDPRCGPEVPPGPPAAGPPPGGPPGFPGDGFPGVPGVPGAPPIVPGEVPLVPGRVPSAPTPTPVSRQPSFAPINPFAPSFTP